MNVTVKMLFCEHSTSLKANMQFTADSSLPSSLCLICYVAILSSPHKCTPPLANPLIHIMLLLYTPLSLIFFFLPLYILLIPSLCPHLSFSPLPHLCCMNDAYYAPQQLYIVAMTPLALIESQA